MATTLRQTIPPLDAGRTLHDWLVGRFRYLDAAGWHAQFAAGRITRNGALASADDRLAAGDRIAFTPPPPPTDLPRPVRTIPVLFADGDLVVVDKAPHLVVQHEAAFLQFTFLHDLAERFPPGDGQPRLEPVHRLDRETSGVLVLARSPRGARGMQRQFEAHAIEKEYLAVASGTIEADRHELRGSIGLATTSTVPTRRAVVPDGTPGSRFAHTPPCVCCSGCTGRRWWPCDHTPVARTSCACTSSSSAIRWSATSSTATTTRGTGATSST